MKNLVLANTVIFPISAGININMMPFIMGNKESVPQEYRQYWGLIEACQLERAELGKVGFLSVSESFVDAGKSQRRGGIHTEGHPDSRWGGDSGAGWGRSTDTGTGGIYMASTLENSCRAWDYYVDQPGHMGDCDHLSDTLKDIPAVYMGAGDLFWMTDRTPHEALTVKDSGPRQWFRLVTSAVDLWYSDHSTHNRLGIIPKCKIIYGDKFSAAA